MKRIAIIGGGAAGLAAAVAAAQEAVRAQAKIQVVVFEQTDRVGKSILASGNGRCNFSNAAIEPAVYHHASFVEQAVEALPPQAVLEFFENLGLIWYEEREGRLYPLSNKASTVLDVLRFAAQEAGVEIRCEQKVSAVTPASQAYLVSCEDDSASYFDAVIVACGGKVARSLLPPHYRYHNTQPMLGPLKTNTEPLRGLNNIRVQCGLSTEGFYEEGEVLFRDYGISGIVVFNLSRFVQPGDTISLDLLPAIPSDQIEAELRQRFALLHERSALEFFAGMFQPPLTRAILKHAGVSADTPIKEEDIPDIGQIIKAFSLEVQGVGDYRQCQVQRGGFDIENFDVQSFESKNDKGLYVVGEALDVDGPCGGYNLHWAWTSGIAAGRSIITSWAE